MADQANADDGDSTVIPFAGLTRFNQGELPDAVFGHGSSMRWWATERSGLDDDTPVSAEEMPEDGLHTCIDQLPRATTATAGWKHPITGEWMETGKHNAVVEASRVEDIVNDEPDGDEDGFVGDHALFNIPTDDYAIINPAQFLRPLSNVIRDEGLEDAVFGEFRLFRDGGRVSADVFFDGKHVDHPDMDDDRKPIVTGFQLDWDYFGDTALRIQGVGMDWECINALRNITDPEIIKHSGSPDERVEWETLFRNMLEQLDLKTDQLSQLIHEASQERLDVGDLPGDMMKNHDSMLEAFYAYSGLPGYLAEHAADNVRVEADDPFNPTWWDIHRGATYAVSHHARGDVGAGSSIEQYNRLANDYLTNPAGMADRVEDAFEADMEERDEESLAEEGGGLASIQHAFESVRDKREEYEERQEMIANMAAPQGDA